VSSKHVTLEEYVYKKLKGGVSKYIVLRDLWRSIQERKLKLKDPDPPITLISYVFRLDYTLWFWTSVTLVALTLGLVYVTEYIPLFISARYVLGTIYVLFLPGYSLIEALYPREEDLTPLERVALSIGLSLAVVPLIGLILNYTPWGIRLPSIISSTAAFIIAMLIIALHRKFNFIKLVIINRGLLESRYKR